MQSIKLIKLKKESVNQANETKKQDVEQANNNKKTDIATAKDNLKNDLAASKSSKVKSDNNKVKEETPKDIEQSEQVQQADNNNPQNEQNPNSQAEKAEQAKVQAEAQEVRAEIGDVPGMPTAEEIAKNPEQAEDKLDKAIAQAEQPAKTEQAQDSGKNDDTYVDENGIVRKNLEPVVSDEQKAEIEAEMTKVPEVKQDENIQLPDMTEYNNAKAKEVTKRYKQQKRQEKFNKASEIFGYVGQAASGGMQIAQAISSASKDDDKTEHKTKVLNLSNLKKAKALMKKLKQRRQSLTKAFNKYYAQ